MPYLLTILSYLINIVLYYTILYCAYLLTFLLMGFIPYARLQTQMLIWIYLELSGAMWRCLELSGATWSYLDLSTAIWKLDFAMRAHLLKWYYRFNSVIKCQPQCRSDCGSVVAIYWKTWSKEPPTVMGLCANMCITNIQKGCPFASF